MDQDAVEEIKRHFGVVAEDLRSEIRAVAEGQDLPREQLSSRIDGLEREMRSELEEVTAMIRLTSLRHRSSRIALSLDSRFQGRPGAPNRRPAACSR